MWPTCDEGNSDSDVWSRVTPPPSKPHSPFLPLNYVSLCEVQVLGVLELAGKDSQVILWTLHPQWAAKNIWTALPAEEEKKAQPRDQNMEMHLNQPLYSLYWILSAFEGQPCRLRLLHLEAPLVRLVRHIGSCEWKWNFHTLPSIRPYERKNIEPILFVCDWRQTWKKNELVELWREGSQKATTRFTSESQPQLRSFFLSQRSFQGLPSSRVVSHRNRSPSKGFFRGWWWSMMTIGDQQKEQTTRGRSHD